MIEPELANSLLHASMYHESRSFGTRIGRFHTPDRARGNIFAPQRLNRYSYVGGDPINREDPTGRFIAPLVATCEEDSMMGWDGSFLLSPTTGGPEPDDISCAPLLLPPPPPPGEPCDFTIRPNGDLKAQQCSARKANKQIFTVPIKSSSPPSCAIRLLESKCSAGSTGDVQIDDANTYWDTTFGQCNLSYWAEGDSGNSAGTYTLLIQIQFNHDSFYTTHTSMGRVYCP